MRSRRRTPAFRRRASTRARAVAVVLGWIAAATALIGLLLGLERVGLPVPDMLRDPLPVTNDLLREAAPEARELTPLDGALSTLGLLLWGMTVGVCVTGAVVLRRRGTASEGSLFMLATAVLVALAMLDDTYLLHELVAPRYLGVSEAATLGAYAGLAGLWALRFRHELRQSDLLLLGIAGALFAASTVADLETVVREVNVEEGLKLIAIVALLAYCLGEAKHRLSA